MRLGKILHPSLPPSTHLFYLMHALLARQPLNTLRSLLEEVRNLGVETEEEGLIEYQASLVCPPHTSALCCALEVRRQLFDIRIFILRKMPADEALLDLPGNR